MMIMGVPLSPSLADSDAVDGVTAPVLMSITTSCATEETTGTLKASAAIVVLSTRGARSSMISLVPAEGGAEMMASTRVEAELTSTSMYSGAMLRYSDRSARY